MKHATILLFAFVISVLAIRTGFSQTETIIKWDSLPASANADIKKNYGNYTVDKVLSIVDKQHTNTYKVELIKKTKFLVLGYDKDGQLISKEKSRIYTFDGTEKHRTKPVNSGGDNSGGGHGGHVH